MFEWRGCSACIHFNDNGTCAAYPDGIPAPIRNGDVPHTEPLLNDNGIQYHPIRVIAETQDGFWRPNQYWAQLLVSAMSKNRQQHNNR